MNIRTTDTASPRAREIPGHCCEDECPSGSRNNYFIGKRLSPASYRLEQDFLNGRRHLLNRAIHGWGVVYGFAVTPAATAAHDDHAGIVIGKGLALDRVGRELWQPDSATLKLDNLVVLDDTKKPMLAEGKLNDRLERLSPNAEECWLLSAHYAERQLDPLLLAGDCDCQRHEWDRTCETIVYSLRRIPCGECCRPYECELHCECSPDTPCCSRHDGQADDVARREAELRDNQQQALRAAEGNEAETARIREQFERELAELAQYRPKPDPDTHGRGGCACLCEHLTDLAIGADCQHLTDIGDCTRADLGHAVPFACLRLNVGRCGDWEIAAVHDACGPRRLVKRNDLLFDLINGCDLTRIVETGWGDWHRRDAPPVPFEDFVAALGWDGQQAQGRSYETEKFWVRFSRPVRKDTIKPDCFVMVIMSDQTEGCWREYYRVPIVAIYTEEIAGDPVGYARLAGITVSGGWLRDAVIGDGSVFLRGETYIEIEIRGGFLVDCLGQTVDADPHGLRPVPTGGDGPGGNYVSTFTVARRVVPETTDQSGTAVQRRPRATS